MWGSHGEVNLLGSRAFCKSANPAVLQALGSPGYDAFTL